MRDVAGLLLVTAIALPLSAQPASGDSARAAALFREAAGVARGVDVSDERRTKLLRRIAHAQSDLGDHGAALETSTALGPWRRQVRSDVMCSLLENRRFDDALQLAHEAPTEERDWELAHLASQLAKPPFSRRLQHPDAIDTIALARRGLAAARGIRDPRARTDALLSIASTVRRRGDTSSIVLPALLQARAALDSVRRGEDAENFVTSRRLLLFSALGDAGRVDEALAGLRTLPTRDRLETVGYMRSWPSHREPRVRAELRALVTLLPRVRDPNVRAHYAEGVALALRESGDSAMADSVVAANPVADPTTGRPASHASLSATFQEYNDLRSTRSVSDWLGVIAAMPDPERVGFRARAYVDLIQTFRRAGRDTTSMVLRLATDDARRSTLDQAMRDTLLAEIAEWQLSGGFHDDGLVTVALIRDEKVAARALATINDETRLSPQARRALLVRVASPSLQARASAELLSAVIDSDVSDTLRSWATALVDSLGFQDTRELVSIAVSHRFFAAGDTASARGQLLSLLVTHSPERPWRPHDSIYGDNLLIQLVRIGATDDVVQWARALASRYLRAVALFETGKAIVFWNRFREPHWFSNGGDSCREAF